MNRIHVFTIYPGSSYEIDDNQTVLSVKWDEGNRVFYVLVGPKIQAPQGN